MKLGNHTPFTEIGMKITYDFEHRRTMLAALDAHHSLWTAYRLHTQVWQGPTPTVQRQSLLAPIERRADRTTEEGRRPRRKRSK